jgi:hypothetical protein
MKRFKIGGGDGAGAPRKVVLLVTALPVMLIALGGVGLATEGVTDGWLHSGVAEEPRRTNTSAVTDGWYHSEIGEQARAAAPARRAVTDGWLGSTVGENARAETARAVAAAEELAGSTDGWLHSVVGDAAREQQPIRVVDSPAQTQLPDTTLIVSVISTALLAGMGGYFLRTRLAL